MDLATALAAIDTAESAITDAVTIYNQVKDALSETDRATLDAKLAALDAHADALTISTEARLDDAAKEA